MLVKNVISGRLYEKVIEDCLQRLDLALYSAKMQQMPPIFDYVTSALLYHALTHRAWNLFKSLARQRRAGTAGARTCESRKKQVHFEANAVNLA